MTNKNKFPKINASQLTSRKGIIILREVVENKLNWLFRENHLEDDFGIDGYLDIISRDGKITGKSLAFQLKTGESYFKEKNEIGYIFRGETKHLNYYINYQLPVLIILIDPDSKLIIWDLFEASKTEKASSSWKMTIPRNKTLQESSIIELLSYVGPVTDYSSQLEEEWQINEMLKKNNRILFTIPKTEIINKQFQFILDGLNRVQATSDLTLHLKNKIDISFDDYDDDPRELFEIPEVKNWIVDLFQLSNCWPYLMAMDELGSFMKLALFSHLPTFTKRVKENGDFAIDYDAKDGWEFIQIVFDKLNKYCDEKNLDAETNKEISYQIIYFYSGGAIDMNKQE